MSKDNLIQSIAKLLSKKKKTISVAESCSGGLLSNFLTNVPGSSNYFKLGIVAYTNEAKVKLLNLPQKTLKKYGSISKQIAILMAKDIKRICKTDIAISTTGLLGPEGREGKPVGLVYVGIVNGKKAYCKKFNFKGTRKENKQNTVKECLKLLKQTIETD